MIKKYEIYSKKKKKITRFRMNKILFLTFNSTKKYVK